MRRYLTYCFCFLTAVTMLTIFAGQMHAESNSESTPPATSLTPTLSNPRQTLQGIILALSSGDAKAWFDAQPKLEQDHMRGWWQSFTDQEPNPHVDAIINIQLALFTQAQGEDMIWQQVKPSILKLKTSDLIKELTNVQKILQVLAMTNKDIGALPELPFVQEILPLIRDWLKTSGLDSIENAKASLKQIRTTVGNTGITNIEGLRALSFEQMLEKSSLLIAAIKNITLIYGIDLVEICNSVEITEKIADDKLLFTITFTSKKLDKPLVLNTAFSKTKDGFVWLLPDRIIAIIQRITDAQKLMREELDKEAKEELEQQRLQHNTSDNVHNDKMPDTADATTQTK